MPRARAASRLSFLGGQDQPQTAPPPRATAHCPGAGHRGSPAWHRAKPRETRLPSCAARKKGLRSRDTPSGPPRPRTSAGSKLRRGGACPHAHVAGSGQSRRGPGSRDSPGTRARGRFVSGPALPFPRACACIIVRLRARALPPRGPCGPRSPLAMSYNYVVTAQKPTAVNGCVTGTGLRAGGGWGAVRPGRGGGGTCRWRRGEGEPLALTPSPPRRTLHVGRGPEPADRQEHAAGDLCGQRRGAAARQGGGHVRQDRSHGALPPQGERRAGRAPVPPRFKPRVTRCASLVREPLCRRCFPQQVHSCCLIASARCTSGNLAPLGRGMGLALPAQTAQGQ